MKSLEGDGASGAEIGHLAAGVNPGVGAARADEATFSPVRRWRDSSKTC